MNQSTSYTEPFIVKHRSTLSLAALVVILFATLAGRVQAQFDIRMVHMIADGPHVDVFFNNLTDATVTDLAYAYTTPLITRLPVGSGTLNMRVAPAGAGIGATQINANAEVKTGYEYTAVIYATQTSTGIKMLERSKTKVPGPNKALLRVLNLTDFTPATAVDVYADSLAGTPLFSGVAAEAVSNFADVAGEPRTLFVTRAGSTTAIGQFIVPLVSSGQMTVIVSGASGAELKVHALSGENHEGYLLPTLQGIQGGMLSSVRVVHAWYQPQTSGTGIQSLDVYLNNGVQPRAAKLHYRTTSDKFGPLTDTTATIQYAPVDEGAQASVYTQTIRLHRDTDYVSILTKSKEGAAAALTLGAPSGIPGNKLDSLSLRVAYVTDYHPTVRIRITDPDGVIDVPALGFLTATDWYTIPKGAIKIEAFANSDTTAFYTKNFDGNLSATYLTVIVLGSDRTFEIDVLNELLPQRQIFDASTGVESDAVAGNGMNATATPNPSSEETTIAFAMPTAGLVRLTVVDPLGRVVAMPLDDVRPAGTASVKVNTGALPAGPYFYRVDAPHGQHASGRLVVVH